MNANPTPHERVCLRCGGTTFNLDTVFLTGPCLTCGTISPPPPPAPNANDSAQEAGTDADSVDRVSVPLQALPPVAVPLEQDLPLPGHDPVGPEISEVVLRQTAGAEAPPTGIPPSNGRDEAEETRTASIEDDQAKARAWAARLADLEARFPALGYDAAKEAAEQLLSDSPDSGFIGPLFRQASETIREGLNRAFPAERKAERAAAKAVDVAAVSANEATTPRFLSIGEVYDAAVPPVDGFLGDDLLARETVNLIAGRRAAGKTYSS